MESKKSTDMACIDVTITPLRDGSALTTLCDKDGVVLCDKDGVVLCTGSPGGGISVSITQVCSVG